MASPFLFLTTVGSSSALFRHWTLVIVLTSLLVTENLNYFTVNAQPSMILHELPKNFHSDPSTSTIDSITLDHLHNFTFKSNSLAKVPLRNVNLYFYILLYLINGIWNKLIFFFRCPKLLMIKPFLRFILLMIPPPIVLLSKYTIRLFQNTTILEKVIDYKHIIINNFLIKFFLCIINI